MSEHYSIFYHCSNCGRRISCTFKRGEKAPGIVTCTFCGCHTTRKEETDWGIKEVKPYTSPPTLPRPTWTAKGDRIHEYVD